MKIIVYCISFLFISINFTQIDAASNYVLLNRIAIIIEMDNDNVSYTIGSTKLNSSDLYNELIKIYGSKAKNTQVAIVMHDNVPLKWLRRLDAIIAKIGAKEIRYFCFDNYKRLIIEIQFTDTKSFTLDPKVLLQ